MLIFYSSLSCHYFTLTIASRHENKKIAYILYQTVWPELHGVGVNADVNIPWFIETGATNSN